ncbi:MAG: FUSC family protein [Cellulosilyticum sp.]|nr:FUSC family protein [Cellulosilyticum sp.]
MKRKHKLDNDYKEIFYKGTITLLTTFGAGALFGKENMMIAFIMVIGSSILASQDLKIKTLYKTIRLILLDILIVGIAYIASLNMWLAIPINLATIFIIIYLNVSLYEPMTYRTFLMLYVFCQYTEITLLEIPKRIAMVIFTVTIVVIMIYIEQNKIKTLLPPQIEKAFRLLYGQLTLMQEGNFDTDISNEISYHMNELACTIYGSSFRRYFTTYIGKIHFYFYLNVSYFNFLLEQIYKQNKNGIFEEKHIGEIAELFNEIQRYFHRDIKRQDVIKKLEEYLDTHQPEDRLTKEITSTIFALRKNFQELDNLSIKHTNNVYDEWKHTDLKQLQHKIRQQFAPKGMSFNFATRMSVVLTATLLIAQVLGFYKFIWAIIPIMSITQPYVEDTNKRRIDRLESNLIAAFAITVIIDVIQVRWIIVLLLVVAFYLYYGYKDYYHISLFMTIISMCISTVNAGINQLFFYRVVYVTLGVVIVGLISKIKPYRLEDGIKELVNEIETLNHILEEESIKYVQEKADLDRIREAIIYSAVLCQKLYLKNKKYQDKEVEDLIRLNTEFVVRLGYSILRN